MKKTKLAAILVLCAIAASCGGRRHSDGDGLRSANDYNLPSGMRKLCGSPGIVGTVGKSFRNGGCGIENPVKIYSVSGIKLSNPATVNCTTARAFEQWVNGSAIPTAGRIDKKLTGMKVAASYACRNRNHKKGGKLSEHAKGNAIDISGFSFSDGSNLTVQDAYSSYRSYFETVRRQACGTFGTVLGPGVRLHNDHFHFDTASYSYGPYCK